MSNMVKPLVVDGEKLPMHSSYLFELKKVYVSENERTNTGAIPVFSEKFFVPYFTVKWAVLSMQDYKKISKLIEKDENVVEYYDQSDNSYKIAKFYAQQPTFKDLYAMKGNFNWVLDTQIVFAGTLNDIGDITVEYNANGGTGAIASQIGLNGEEFVVNSGAILTKEGYVLTSWNTQPDGSGTDYALGSVAAFTSNITLYAQWQKLESYTLSLAYGYGTPNKDTDGKEINSVAVKYNTAISGLPTNVIVLDPSDSSKELIDKDGKQVFSFIGWNKLSQSVGTGTFLSNGSIYDIDGNSTVYAHFDIMEYTLTFNSNEGSVVEPITAEYLTKISLPKPTKEGYQFAGWYIEDTFTTRFSKATMPYENLTLYARWEEI